VNSGLQLRTTHIAVVGLMGVGKTTTADLLAHRLGQRHRDSDGDIETLIGRTGREIAAEEGIEVLHTLEEAVALGALASAEPLVISVAGWVIESALCRAALTRRAFVVLLDLPLDEIVARASTGSHRRPIDAGELQAIAERRLPLFRVLADLIVDARNVPSTIVDQVLVAVSQ
jgi:shikimate kinase